MLLDGLAERAAGHRLVRVRRAQLRLDPGLRTAWKFVRGRLRDRSDDDDTEHAAPAEPPGAGDASLFAEPPVLATLHRIGRR
jgi:hypothetical protein